MLKTEVFLNFWNYCRVIYNKLLNYQQYSVPVASRLLLCPVKKKPTSSVMCGGYKLPLGSIRSRRAAGPVTPQTFGNARITFQTWIDSFWEHPRPPRPLAEWSRGFEREVSSVTLAVYRQNAKVQETAISAGWKFDPVLFPSVSTVGWK